MMGSAVGVAKTAPQAHESFMVHAVVHVNHDA
jgi:hypothetical protein